MSNNEHILLTLELHNDRLQSRNQVFVRLPYSDTKMSKLKLSRRRETVFTSRIAVLELVEVSSGEIFRKLLLDLFVRHLFANALKRQKLSKHCRKLGMEANSQAYGIDLVECAPSFLRGINILRSLNGALHPRGPHAQMRDLLTFDVLAELCCVSQSAL